MNSIKFDNDIKSKIESAYDSGFDDIFDAGTSSEMWNGIENKLNKQSLIRRRLRIYSGAVATIAAASLAIVMLVVTPTGNVDPIHLVELSQEKDTPKTISSEKMDILVAKDIQEKQVSNYKKIVISDTPETTLESEISENKNITKEQAESAITQEGSGRKKRSEPEKEYKTISEQIADNNYYAMLLDQERTSRRYRLGVSSNMMFSNSMSGPRASSIRYTYGGSGVPVLINPSSETSYSIPLTAGIQLQVGLTDRLSIAAGINFTHMQSRFDAEVQGIGGFKVTQTLQYIGIPVNLYYNLLTDRSMRFYVNGGGAVEKGVNLSQKWISSNQQYAHLNGSSGFGVDGVQFSAYLGVGFEYWFNKFMGVYLDPGVTYYFNHNQPKSLRTDQPLQMKFELGLRFHL